MHSSQMCSGGFSGGWSFFASGVFGILGKLWGKKDVVDDEVKAVRGDFVYLSIIINKSDQLGQGESEPLCCDDMATKLANRWVTA